MLAENLRVMSLPSKSTEPSLETFSIKIDLEREDSNLCNICNKAFNYPCELKRHLWTHTGEKPFVCNHCNKGFTRKGNLKSHLKKHPEVTDTPAPEETLVCKVCHQMFANKSHLNTHRRSHTDGKLHVCSYCNKQFDRRSAWKYHMGLHIKAETPAAETRPHGNPVVCNECHKAFATRSSLNRHKRAHRREKPYACDNCDKKFVYYRSFKYHLCCRVQGNAVGGAGKRYKRLAVCDICHRTFNNKYYMKIHLRTHTGEKPYVCNYCNKEFIHSMTLTYHVRKMHPKESTADGIPPPVVLERPRVYRRRKNRQASQRKKDYVCQQCFKHFGRRKQLNNHLCIVVRSVKKVEMSSQVN